MYLLDIKRFGIPKNRKPKSVYKSKGSDLESIVHLKKHKLYLIIDGKYNVYSIQFVIFLYSIRQLTILL